MDKERSTYELIQAYLSGRADAAEVAEVELRLKSDPGFKQYFESHQDADMLIRMAEQTRIRTQLQHIHATRSEGTGGKWLGRSLGLILVGGICTLAYWMWSDQGSQQQVSAPLTTEQLATKYNREDIEAKPASPSSDSSLMHGSMDADGAHSQLEMSQESSEKALLGTEAAVPAGDERSTAQDSRAKKNVEVDKAEGLESTEEGAMYSEEEKPVLIPPHEEPDEAQGESERIRNFPCSEYSPQIVFDVKSSCIDKQEGIIEVLVLEAATYPSFGINGGPAVPARIFKGLAPGEYSIVAIDMNGCQSLSRNVAVESQPCNFIIYPAQHRYWEIDLKRFSGEEVALEIYDATSGARVFMQKLQPGQDPVWDGRSNSGESLAMGSYVYVLIGGNQSQRGNLTLIR